MKILSGLKSGAVLQRDENNLCKCFFRAINHGHLRSSIGNVISLGADKYQLTGIPTGGPYELYLFDDEDKEIFKEIYVGDIWILAGQSNMEGAGKMRKKQIDQENNPISSIRAYYMKESWDVARPQLHQLWESMDSCISEPFRKERLESLWKTEYPETQVDGVGPGLYFALEMQKRTNGVPQGLIPCGVGGSSLTQWTPHVSGNLYAAMKRRYDECGGNVKGVFWYQGESQTSIEGCENYVSDMRFLVKAMRWDFGNPDLPLVQVQINKYHGAPKETDIWWTRLRELQRTLDQEINNLATVYSIDCGLDDLIHLSSESQEIVGRRAAEAMAVLTTGNGYPSPQFDGFEIVTDDYNPFRVNIIVKYKNVMGGLHAPGIPSGFTILDKEDGEPIREIACLDLEKDSIRIKVELEPEKIEEYYVCYGYGNTCYCNITDSTNRSIPAMGPLKIKDNMTK